MSDKTPNPPDAEYAAMRSEITAWIAVEYALIAATATVSAISLGFFRDTGRWPFYSPALLLICACFGLLTSFARSKIMLASTYIAIFHRKRTYWDRLIDLVERDVPDIATRCHKWPLFSFYLIIGIVVVGYPLASSPDWTQQLTMGNSTAVLLAIAVYTTHLVIFFRSYHKASYRSNWQRCFDDISNGTLDLDSRDASSVQTPHEARGRARCRPMIVCLCGSTRLMKTAFVDVNRDETLKGNIVLSVGVDMKDESQEFLKEKTDVEKAIIKDHLDWLHREKIDFADLVIILKTAEKELGKSTQEEMEYAERRGKRVEVREFPELGA